MTIASIINSVRCSSSILRTTLILSLALIGTQAFAANNNSIMIHKTATGAAADQEFSFTGTGTGFPEDFTLVNGQVRTVSGLAAGTYTVTESPTEGWRLASISCSVENDAASTVETDGATATITLADDELVECEFINEVAACGDGVLDSGEFCDAGITDDTDPNFVANCREDCTFCGDGELNGDEQCETGDANCSSECTIQGAVKIVKKMVSHNFETIPADGFRFLAGFDLENEFFLNAGEQKTFLRVGAGENTFYELRPMVPAPNGGDDVESQGWAVTSVDCVCLFSTVGENCASTFDSNLEARDEQLLDLPADPHHVIGSVTVNVVGGETVVCTFTNEDQVCPPGEQSPPAGTTNNNNNQAQTTNTGGLASTNPTTTSSGSGCSSTGVGIAGLSTMFMLAMPLIALRLTRRAKAKA